MIFQFLFCQHLQSLRDYFQGFSEDALIVDSPQYSSLIARLQLNYTSSKELMLQYYRDFLDNTVCIPPKYVLKINKRNDGAVALNLLVYDHLMYTSTFSFYIIYIFTVSISVYCMFSICILLNTYDNMACLFQTF